jgi:two-component system response regulator AtoC
LTDEARADRDRLTSMLGAGGKSGRGRKAMMRTVEDRRLLYRSAAMEQVMSRVEKFAVGDQPVLVTGETGTGKELIARLIHAPGGQAPDTPFVAVNCAAISDQLWEDELFGHVKGAYTDAKADRPGRIHEAGAGVLFMDEIGEMPLEMQAKLLRLLQERKYAAVGSDADRTARCRFVFATNRDLPDMIAKGGFREDLYYRINVFHLDLPPLRSRPEDIPLLLEHFLERSAGELGFALREIEPAAMEALTRYAWPGNIRELENFIVRASALSEGAVLNRSDLPLEMRGVSRRVPEVVITRNEIPYSEKNLRELVDDYTRRIIEETLKKTEGNRTKAADLLGVKRGSLLYRMKELGVE